MKRGCGTRVERRALGASLALASGAFVLAHTSHALAQEAGAEFSAQRFDSPAGPRNFITTRGVRTDGEMAWSAGLMLNYGFEPLSVRSCTPGVETDTCDGATSQDLKVLENLVAADLLGSLTPFPRLQVGLKFPIAYAKGQGLAREGDVQGVGDPVEAFGIADPELEVKFRAYGEPKDPIVAGAALYLTAPLGQATMEGAYTGDDTPGAGLRAIFDGEAGQFSFAGNIGGVLRGTGSLETAAIRSETKVGSELRYGVAGGFRPSPLLRVIVDGFGSSRLSTIAGENALEVGAGVQVTPFGPLTITGGAGTRLVEGIGTPLVRAFLGFVYSVEQRDRDQDGFDDDDDRCPTEPEDRDGYEDSDGCPDPDNDLDTIADSADKCPMQAEDADGFEDTDGCPELDNDKDGLPDTGDRCPLEPETKNGFDDDDGCPDVSDKDRDGVPDDRDQCPDGPEDTDGFEDTDGCPDPDNDQDGIPDNQDECVDEKETVNDFEDEDGCPDEKPKGRR